MRNENDRMAFSIECMEKLHDLMAGNGIKGAGRLIGKEDRRIADKSTGYCDALFLPS